MQSDRSAYCPTSAVADRLSAPGAGGRPTGRTNPIDKDSVSGIHASRVPRQAGWEGSLEEAA
jgi:hypothetical protein